MGLVASVVGSTGVIGVITASVQLSRRARLKRSIAAAREVAGAVVADSRTRRVLQQAIETDILRLAAMSMVTLNIRVRLYATVFVSALLGSVLLSWVLWITDVSIRSLLPWLGEGSSRETPMSTLATAALFMIMIVVPGAILVDVDLQRKRERVVVSALVQVVGIVETPEIRSYKIEQSEWRRAEAKRQAKKAEKTVAEDTPS